MMKIQFVWTRKVWIAILAGLLVLAVMAGTALAKPAATDGVTYSLEDKGGPNETYSFTYFIVDVYSAETSGSLIGNCLDTNVGLNDHLVQDGLFTFYLACGTFFDNHDIFMGGARWVEVQVRPGASVGAYATLPRQPVSPAPYAWGLLPGTWVSGASWGDALGETPLSIENTNTTGSALRVSGGGTGYTIYSEQTGTSSGLAIYGKITSPGAGISGVNFANGIATWGYSYEYNGVGGGTGRVDNNYGLYTTDNIYSLNYHTLGSIMQVVQNGGSQPLERGDVVVIAGMGKPLVDGASPVILVAKADSANSTAVIGVVAESYSIEWLKSAEKTNPTGDNASGAGIPVGTAGPIAPGELLLVVVSGPCQVKVSALDGAIQPGDLLATGGKTGFAAVAKTATVDGVSFSLPGTVFAKALEPLSAGKDGLIYVFVTLK
jgi:hypothetical protein